MRVRDLGQEGEAPPRNRPQPRSVRSSPALGYTRDSPGSRRRLGAERLQGATLKRPPVASCAFEELDDPVGAAAADQLVGRVEHPGQRVVTERGELILTALRAAYSVPASHLRIALGDVMSSPQERRWIVTHRRSTDVRCTRPPSRKEPCDRIRIELIEMSGSVELMTAIWTTKMVTLQVLAMWNPENNPSTRHPRDFTRRIRHSFAR